MRNVEYSHKFEYSHNSKWKSIFISSERVRVKNTRTRLKDSPLNLNRTNLVECLVN
jgi:hypothetical protein